MTWITIEEAKINLNMWLEAEKAVATGQSYKCGTHSLTRADLGDITDRISYWLDVIDDLENGGDGRRRPRVFRVVPLNN